MLPSGYSEDPTVMHITYRRTGGVFTLLALAAVALAVTVVTIVLGATVLVVVLAIGVVGLVARAVLPASWRRRTVQPQTPWPQETIEATVMKTER